MYVINDDLTLFKRIISNGVGELMYLNETTILEKALETGKKMNEDDEVREAIESFVKQKLFENEGDKKAFMVENPYVSFASLLNASLLGILALISFS